MPAAWGSLCGQMNFHSHGLQLLGKAAQCETCPRNPERRTSALKSPCRLMNLYAQDFAVWAGAQTLVFARAQKKDAFLREGENSLDIHIYERDILARDFLDPLKRLDRRVAQVVDLHSTFWSYTKESMVSVAIFLVIHLRRIAWSQTRKTSDDSTINSFVDLRRTVLQKRLIQQTVRSFT